MKMFNFGGREVIYKAQEAEDRFGSLVETSFLVPLCQIAFLMPGFMNSG